MTEFLQTDSRYVFERFNAGREQIVQEIIKIEFIFVSIRSKDQLDFFLVDFKSILLHESREVFACNELISTAQVLEC